MSETVVLDYWPAMFVADRRLDLLSANFAIDWGGRSAECEFQDPLTFECVSATYYYLTDDWSRTGWPTTDRLTVAIRQIFAAFDTNCTDSNCAYFGKPRASSCMCVPA